VGISTHEMDKLFNHFEQTESGIKHGSGTGLGLALSRELARLMQGDILVSSQPGEGSIFSFYVETEPGDQNTVQPTPSRRIISLGKDRKHDRILVADDNPENLTVALSLLNLIGFETCGAINGNDAIDKFHSFLPDLVLMDLRMPDRDGFEVTRTIRSTPQGARTPIILLTASIFDDDRNRITELGIEGVIRKPFRSDDLFHMIGEVLGIEYIYEDEPEVTTYHPEQMPEDTLSAVRSLPGELLQSLLDAVSKADIGLLVSLSRQLEPTHLPLARLLMTHIRNYDYTSLHRILTQ